MSNTFLPSGYEIPASTNKYMKLLEGENRLRILSSPIVGNEYWNHDNKPVRTKMNEDIDLDDVRPEKDGKPGRVKHFWAMPVYDCKDGQIKILEITQAGIQKAVKELAGDEDWGSPVNYDIVISRQGEGLKTEYGVVPKPAKALDKKVIEMFKEVQEKGFDLSLMFDGEDPFNPSQNLVKKGSEVFLERHIEEPLGGELDTSPFDEEV